ncbi:MAG: hypothetical protein KDE54_13310 [Caldilineaceae bacterium]|nr:hypothetical protein [Caldilineaceae bacterium]MCB0138397.1 hypothetical protein [Caldilineaceae bacterium]
MAIDEATTVYKLLSDEIQTELIPGVIEIVSEAMLLIIEQFDILNQMLDEPELPPEPVIELNRHLRDMLRLLTKERLPPAGRVAAMQMIQAAGAQLQALVVVKEIRT